MAIFAPPAHTVSGGTTAYQIDNSLRFDGSNDYLSRTFGTCSTDGRKKWTWSGWVKRSKLGYDSAHLFGAYVSGTNYAYLMYRYSATPGYDTLEYYDYDGYYLTTTQVFRDPSAWMHVVLVFDTPNATQADRIKLYVNGTRVTAFSRSNLPASTTFEGRVNNNINHDLGRWGLTPTYFDGYLSDIYFIDGQALSPTDFGETNADGVWVPIAYTGTYGNNGFHLDFANGNSLYALGQDSGATSLGNFSESLYASGTNIGNLTDVSVSNTLAAAFNGAPDTGATCAFKSNGTSGTLGGYVGKDWGVGNTKTITGFVFYGPTNEFVNSQTTSSTITLTLQGSTDNFSSSIVDLGTATGTDKNTGFVAYNVSTLITTTAYRYHRVKIESSGTFTGGGCRCGELTLLEAGSTPLYLGNNWTLTNMTRAAGVNECWMTDTPTNNFATLNPLDKDTSHGTLSNGNLSQTTATYVDNTATTRATLATTTGKFYFEVVCDKAGTTHGNQVRLGFGDTTSNPTSGITTAVYADWNKSDVSNTFSSGGYSTTANYGDVAMFAIDFDAGKYWAGLNGTWLNSGNPNAGTGNCGTFTAGSLFAPYIFTSKGGPGYDQYQSKADVNFGQRTWGRDPASYNASNFKALSTANLPTVSITNPREHFDIIGSRTGTAGTYNSNTTKALLFQPDMVWIKSRGRAVDHAIYDSVRGVQKRLESNNTDAEVTGDTTGLTAFNSDGYSGGALDQINGTTATNNYVDWLWKANGAGSTISVGQYSTGPNVPSIASTVSANTTAGFSIVTWTQDGSSPDTIGHGLGRAPKMVIFKNRDISQSWNVWHTGLSSSQHYLVLESTAAQNNAGTVFSGTWSDTVFGVQGVYATDTNKKMLAYCFAEIPGFSKFGSYSGNNSTTGPFVYLGFRPRYLLIKCSSTGGAGYDWNIIDTARDPYNLTQYALRADTSDNESTVGTVYVQPVANGFFITSNSSQTNASQTYIYAAFAEYPFGGSNVAPAPAR